MDPEKALEQVVKHSKLLMARLFEPRPAVISAEYLERNTVEPLDYSIVWGQIYSVRIRRAPFEWRKGNFADGLAVSLLERSVDEYSSTLLEIYFSLPKRQDTDWVNMVASRMETEYEQLKIGAFNRIPDREMLRQLIAGRIEYYMRGGSAQNHRN